MLLISNSFGYHLIVYIDYIERTFLFENSTLQYPHKTYLKKDFHPQFLLIIQIYLVAIAFAKEVFPTPIGPSTVINGMVISFYLTLKCQVVPSILSQLENEK